MSFSDDPRRAAMPRPKDRVLSTETVGDPEADDPEAAAQEGAAAGAVLGTVVLGPIGAVAGAVIGSAAGTIGETVDAPAAERRISDPTSGDPIPDGHREGAPADDDEVREAGQSR